VIKANAIRAHSTGKDPHMRRIYNYRISKEDFWEMLHEKRFNPCLVISFRDKSGQHRHKLSAGYSDVLDVYREGIETYVLSTNSMLGYVGLEVIHGDEKLGEIFMEEDELKDVLRSENLAPFNVIKYLREYIT
jgi:hypothetical protein